MGRAPDPLMTLGGPAGPVDDGLGRAEPEGQGGEKVKDHTAVHLETNEPAASDALANQKGMQAYIDPADGKPRKPTPQEERELLDALTALTNRSTEGLEVIHWSDGSISVD